MAQHVAPSSGQPSHTTNISASSPIEFKRQLLAALDDEWEIMYLLSMREWDEIMIFQFQGIEYVLVCDVEALPRLRFQELDDDTIYCYCQLKYPQDKQRQTFETFSSTLPKHAASAKLDGDIFLPIGSIRESLRKVGNDGYVCMLNISTSPMSMWAVYDYYYDSHKPISEYKPMTRAESVMWGSDLILLYEDINDWYPGGVSVTPWRLPEKEMYALGNMVRGHTVFPPEDLMDAVMQYEDSDNAIEEGGSEHTAKIAGGSAA